MFELDHPEITWLVACERSGIVRDALIAAGHSAISCDIYPSRRPGPHYQGDVLDILHMPWGGMIAHPECKFLANSGVQWLYKGGLWENGIDPVRWENMKAGAPAFI